MRTTVVGFEVNGTSAKLGLQEKTFPFLLTFWFASHNYKTEKSEANLKAQDWYWKSALIVILLVLCWLLCWWQDFLGSQVDFPVGDASFFLFFSGHVGASIIATLDLRGQNRMRAALFMDTLNLLQTVRLLATRGHYTIDLVCGAFAGWACYHVAGLYEEGMKPALMASAGVPAHHKTNDTQDTSDS